LINQTERGHSPLQSSASAKRSLAFWGARREWTPGRLFSDQTSPDGCCAQHGNGRDGARQKKPSALLAGKKQATAIVESETRKFSEAQAARYAEAFRVPVASLIEVDVQSW